MLSLVNLPNMSNPILTTTNSKLDTRVKEPSSVIPPPPGVGSSTSDRFNKIIFYRKFVNYNFIGILYKFFLQ